MNNTFYAPNDYRNYLKHFGVKGMKWGVRRYRDYDGSYTQAGVKKYNVTERRYDDADANLKRTKAAYKAGSVTKLELNRAKNERKEALRDLKKDYKRLKRDKLADEGKKLYAEGKTITGNTYTTQSQSVAIAATAYVLHHFGQNRAAAATLIGGSAYITGRKLVDAHRNERIRAYYGHGGNWYGWAQQNAKYVKQYSDESKQSPSKSSSKSKGAMRNEAEKLMRKNPALAKDFGGETDDYEYLSYVARTQYGMDTRDLDQTIKRR